MEEKVKQIEEAAEPILKFLKENYNPHTTVIISEDCIKVVMDEINIPIIYD